MKLLLLSDNFLPAIGGVSIMMHHLANACVARGVETLVGPPPDLGDVSLLQYYNVMRGPRDPWVQASRWYKIREQTRRLQNLTEKVLTAFPADAVLMGNALYSPRIWNGVYTACRARRIPIATYAHGADIRWNLYRQDRLRRIGGSILGLANIARSHGQWVAANLRHSDVVFTNSNYTAGLVQELTGQTAVVTGCGLADDDYQREIQITPRFDRTAKQHWRAALGLPDKPTVCFVGRLARNKNVQLILRALAERPDLQAVIVGEGSAVPELQELAGSLGVSSRVHWMGKIDEETKWICLRASDILCLLSEETKTGLVEGFGIVLLEAAAAGTPVIAANTGGMTDVVQHGHTGLRCSPKNVRELTEAIVILVADDNLASTCVEEARLQIEHRFNWNSVAEKVIKAMDDARQLALAGGKHAKATRS